MKSSEMAGKSDEEVQLALTDTEKQLFQLRFQAATDRLESPAEIQKARRTIARIKGEQRRRELVKLAATTAEQVPALLADLHAKTEGPGKRRAKRAVRRLELHRESIMTTVQALPAKGK